MTGYGGVPDGRGGRSGWDLLASDADRERVVERLKSAYSEGRLTAGEHDERVGRAYLARTYGDLAGLEADLPCAPGGVLPAPSLTYQPLPPFPGPALPPPPYYPVPQPRTNGQAVASLLCGLAGLPLGVPAVAAVVLGHTARSTIRRTGEGGGPAATAGAVLGYFALVFWGLFLLTVGIH